MAGIAPLGGRDHVPALDGLRGLAVAGVVLFHLGYFPGGFLGVDLFFVLSGYLITTLITREWVARGRIDLLAFWARRARRLLPALILVVAVVAVYASIGAEAIDRGRIRTDGIASLFYVANWNEIAAGTNYFDLIRSPSPLQHMWSLAIEEQFYLLWPLLAIVALGRRRRNQLINPALDRLLALSAGLAALSAGLMIVLHDPGSGIQRVYFGTDTRAAAILFGATLAVILQKWRAKLPSVGSWVLDCLAIVAAGVVAVIWALARGTSTWLFEGGFAVCGLGVTVVIASLATSRQGLLGVLLSWRPLRWLGLISYGIYLWHWPVIVALTPSRTGLHGLALAATRVAVSLALAQASSVALELPIRRGAFPGRRALTLAALSITACVALLLASTTARATLLDEELANATKHPSRMQIATDPVTTTLPTSSRPPVTTLIVGDSGAYYLGAGLARVGGEFDRVVVNRGTVGCGIARGDGRLRLADGRILKDPVGCAEYLDRWHDYLRFFEPEQAMLVLADVGGGDRFVHGRWMSECDPEFDAWFADEVAGAVRDLQSTGAAVTVTTIPDIAVDQPSGASRKVDCRNAALLRGARAAGAHILTLRHWACPTPTTCHDEIDGVEVRPDHVHFLGEGADLAARWIFQHMPS